MMVSNNEALLKYATPAKTGAAVTMMDKGTSNFGVIWLSLLWVPCTQPKTTSLGKKQRSLVSHHEGPRLLSHTMIGKSDA